MIIAGCRRKQCVSHTIACKPKGVIPGKNFRAVVILLEHLGGGAEKGSCLALENIAASSPVRRKCLKPYFDLKKRCYILREKQRIKCLLFYFSKDILLII